MKAKKKKAAPTRPPPKPTRPPPTPPTAPEQPPPAATNGDWQLFKAVKFRLETHALSPEQIQLVKNRISEALIGPDVPPAMIGDFMKGISLLLQKPGQ